MFFLIFLIYYNFHYLSTIFTYKLFWFFLTTFSLCLCYLKYTFNYWKRKGIPHEKPVLIFGNILRSCLGRTSIGEDVKRNYDKFSHHPIHGIYMLSNPILLINDPELIRIVLVKEFSKFRDRGLYYNEKVDPLTSNLFFLPGEKWKRLRSKLTPTFTSGKLKQIYPLIKEIGDGLAAAVITRFQKSDVIEVKDLSSRYTTDTIVSIAFGFNCNSLNIVDSEFRKYGDMIVMKRPNIQLAFGMFSPKILHFLRVPIIDKAVFKFFIKVFSDMVEQRKREKIERNDFLNLLIQLIENGKSSQSDTITLMEAYAQAFVFFFAGFETSSSTIAYALYELAINPDIQEKVHDEIKEILNSSDGCSYENCVNKMKYLDMVVYETLRKHPTSPFLNRICVEDCNYPELNFHVQKGMRVLICASGIMRNERYFPDPEKFDPERFTDENVAARSPYVYLPFGQGPRSCIGMRLGMIQTKVALINLLSEFEFSPCAQTPIPLKYSPRSIVQVPADGIYLKMKRRKSHHFLAINYIPPVYPEVVRTNRRAKLRRLLSQQI